MEKTIKLTRAEKIDRALDGRSASSVLKKMSDAGQPMFDSEFSRCKHGHMNFTDAQLVALSQILGTQITND